MPHTQPNEQSIRENFLHLSAFAWALNTRVHEPVLSHIQTARTHVNNPWLMERDEMKLFGESHEFTYLYIISWFNAPSCTQGPWEDNTVFPVRRAYAKKASLFVPGFLYEIVSWACQQVTIVHDDLERHVKDIGAHKPLLSRHHSKESLRLDPTARTETRTYTPTVSYNPLLSIILTHCCFSQLSLFPIQGIHRPQQDIHYAVPYGFTIQRLQAIQTMINSDHFLPVVH